jgi:hypothetical protein
VAVSAALVACTTTVYRAKFAKPDQAASLDADAPFLKCHMGDGSVYVLRRWRADGARGTVAGSGLHYGVAREVIDARDYEIPVAEVALFETNYPESLVNEGIVVMGVLTAASLAVTAACLANPKACFGSCPTFYASDGTRETLQSEGFSASVARVLEATDVDAMWTARPRDGALDVRMTNDALETHVIDSVRLLSAPRPPGGRVLRAGDVFYAAPRLVAPSSCSSERGDCLADVVATDGREYKSDADARDLATRETIDLRFPVSEPGDDRAKGLLLVARNSLLNTFLFYQALAYMGRSAGDYLARLERAGPRGADAYRELSATLGGIRVEVEGTGGTWREAGVWDEVGPIALEAQVVPLPRGLPVGPLHVRLSATRGYWRIEQAAMADLEGVVVPRAIEPREVLRAGHADSSALAKLRVGGDHLVALPRDESVLRFDVPEGDVELFLESRGYYYEWMRPAWLKEEDALELARFALDGRGAMRRLAPTYKRIEADMDRVFWQSRLGAERVR